MIQFEFDHAVDQHTHWLQNHRLGARADFTDLSMIHIDGSGVDLSGAIFDNVTFNDCDFSESDLVGCSFRYTSFTNVILENTCFTNSVFIETYMKGTNLQNADIWNTFGDGKYIKTIQLDGQHVNYTHEHIQINCKKFKLSEIWNLDDETLVSEVNHNDNEIDELLRWWNSWKNTIYHIINNSPALSS